MDKKTYKMKKRLFYWSGPHVNVQKGNFIFDRLIKDNYEVKPYYDYNLGAGSDLKKRTRQFRKNILSLFLVSRKNDIIFAYDHTRSWILALLFSVLGLKRHVIINNYMYDGASKLKKQLLRIAFKNMRVAVNSPMIKNILIGDLGRNIENKIYVIPDCSEIFGSDFEQKWANTPRESNPPYIFTGGNTRRDFDMVINIAAKHPEWNFVIVAPNTEKNRFSTISENIKVFFQVSTNEFIEKLLAARIVFIPLKSDFQGGAISSV